MSWFIFPTREELMPLAEVNYTGLAVVILAAGQGTRMKSRRPKVMHPLMGRPMIDYVVELATRLSASKPVLVVGHGMELVREHLGDTVTYVEQAEQLGTGHAVLQAQLVLKGRCRRVLVCYGDVPLLREETMSRLIAAHDSPADTYSPITVLTVEMADPSGYGRILRDGDGRVVGIVEHAAATEEQRRIREINTGLYCFDAPWLWDHLPQLPLSAKGEYYLTDLLAMAIAEGQSVRGLLAADPDEVGGINHRGQLAHAIAVMRRRINQRLMLSGVTLVDPATTYVEAAVEIGPDTVIEPGTHIKGKTRIGSGCHLGPNTLIVDSTIGNSCEMSFSVVEEAVLEDEVDIGPFAHLRRGAHLARGVHMGNFGEVKNSYLGPGCKVGHFSYLGDATLGANVNVGAGTITCNYDGQKKNPTTIEDDVFIGSDTMLVAPLKVGARAITGAGSVVTHDVPADGVVYGVPARLRKKTGVKQESEESVES
jgi:bifunctional UDP-N-acetylglucosamine pyrophosphorylase/glucosamine-1-phosphate N-acetyltransferase